MKNKLKVLDFSLGIKASDINHNFNIIKKWIDNERLFVGGIGIVDGFDITANESDFTVTITEGTFIDKKGQEKNIEKRIFTSGDLESRQITETIVCPKEGYLELQYSPYSKSKKKHINYDNIEDKEKPSEEEIKLNEASSKLHVPIIKIVKNKIYINAGDWVGQQITISYYKAEDRIDSIILTQDGDYKYEKSVMSTSPSHVQIPDYSPDYLIGQIYWHISDKIEPIIYMNHRIYRKVFINKKDNQLWLNGEVYKKPKFIYFKEPESPEENDIWYDNINNELLIWKEKDGVFGWTKINDHSTMAINNSYMFNPEDELYPENNQIFLFPKDRLDLNFVPNTDSLLILIDNIVVMKDQYEEIIENTSPDKPYLAKGIGFKLVEPLDRSTPVQVIVHHQVASPKTTETFQRAAIFVNKNHIYYSPENTNKVFETEEKYQVGDNQLEVWVDGLRLVYEVDFKEMKNETETVDKTDLSSRALMSNHFKILKPLKPNQCIDYKITKHVWNYDQLSLVMRETLDTIKSVQTENKNLKLELSLFKKGQESINTSLSQRIEAVSDSIPDTTNMLTTKSVININQMSKTITNRMVTDSSEEVNIFSAQKNNLISDYGIKDYIIIFYVSESENRVLIKNADYTIEVNDVAAPNANIVLKDYLVREGATIYVTRLKIGERRG